jgi:hypothetical protein
VTQGPAVLPLKKKKKKHFIQLIPTKNPKKKEKVN